MKYLTLFLILCAATLFAADSKPKAPEKPKAETFLDPASGGRDYADQGEYRNDWGGAQVIALGNDTFRVVFHHGGLPGAGWDQKIKLRVSAVLHGEGAKFGEKGYRGEIRGGQIKGSNEADEPYHLKKVERKSPTLGAKPPAGAVVLFDGSDLSAAVDAVLEGRPVPERQRPSLGCNIKWRAGKEPEYFTGVAAEE